MVECRKFSPPNIPPFTLNVSSNALLIVDLHAHLVTTEIIGLLGGHFDEDALKLDISVALPCNSLSTSIQCEMDPLSEMKAREILENMSLDICGWYHSHPTFEPNPSIRDIENQSNYQALFARKTGKEPFIGIIVNPVNSMSSCSKFNFVTISSEFDQNHRFRIPFKLPKNIVHDQSVSPSLLDQMKKLIEKYQSHASYTNFSSICKNCVESENQTTYLDKLLISLSTNLHGTPENKQQVLGFIQEILTDSVEIR